jgi:hypothetical protein
LIEALFELSNTSNTQVFISTHSPEIVRKLNFENIILITERAPVQLIQVQEHELPYPSLNEVNYLAFEEASQEYHNELYGYIEAEGLLSTYKNNKPTREYIRESRNGSTSTERIILTEYIRHQIHHPENIRNTRFTPRELKESINLMRVFISSQN